MNGISKVLLTLLLLPAISVADCEPVPPRCYHTKLGDLEQISRAHSGDDYSYLTLNGAEIYKAKTDYMTFFYDDAGFFKNKKYLVTKTIASYTLNEFCTNKEYYGGHCSQSIFLDLSGDKPVISNAFIPDSGNSLIDWVSWGQKNAIIVFEDGSKFKYMNGHVERVIK